MPFPFQKLPFELKAEVARAVDAQDRQHGEWLNLDGEVTLRAGTDWDTTFVKGVQNLSMVDKEMRSACLKFVFDVRPFLPLLVPFSFLVLLTRFSPQPLVLSVKLSEEDRTSLPTLPLAKACPAISITLFGETNETGQLLRSFLSILAHLPACTSVSLMFAKDVLFALRDSDLALADPSSSDPPSHSVPGLGEAAKRRSGSRSGSSDRCRHGPSRRSFKRLRSRYGTSTFSGRTVQSRTTRTSTTRDGCSSGRVGMRNTSHF
jgi:hypothetical protein